MSFSIIAAMAKNRVIGKNNALPWHLPEDFRFFKDKTKGHTIIMGHKTYESLGGALKNRDNIVLTHDLHFKPHDARVIYGLDELKLLDKNNEEIFVIGGAAVYRLTLPFAKRVYLTLIDQNFDGDAFFPVTEFDHEFFLMNRSGVFKAQRGDLTYEFFTFERGTQNSPLTLKNFLRE